MSATFDEKKAVSQWQKIERNSYELPGSDQDGAALKYLFIYFIISKNIDLTSATLKNAKIISYQMVYINSAEISIS